MGAVLIALGIPAVMAVAIWIAIQRFTTMTAIVRSTAAVILPSTAMACLFLIGRVESVHFNIATLVSGISFQLVINIAIIALIERRYARRVKR